MREYGIGQSIPRVEDFRLLTGRGHYTGDIRFPSEARLFVVRSPHAAAHLRGVNAAAARVAPGILAVLTGKDAVAAGLGTFSSRLRRPDRSGRPNFVPPYRVLAVDGVRFVGDPVAAIVAETLEAAKDAAELLEIAYEPCPAVTRTVDAAKPGAPAVWPDVPDNLCFAYALGDRAAADAGFARAAHIARVDLVVNRVSANPIETRVALGLYDAAEDRYTLYTGAQSPHQTRLELAEQIFRLPANRLRVVAPDVGGAFGMKGSFYPEQALVLWAARVTGRPVKWIADRSESFVSDTHARDNVSTAELALAADGGFLALKVRTLANLGAYLAFNGVHTPTTNISGLAGVYTTPAIHVAVEGIFSNTNPTAPYRGAGRPEAIYALERVIDVAAAEMGIDRVELRRRNLIPRGAMPYKTALAYTYDSGEFAENMDRALALADWKGFPQRREAARRRGRLRGIGLANAIEIAGGPQDVPMEEAVEIRFDATGSATILLGSHNQGQGHETSFRQLAAELLGLAPAGVRVVMGDTDKIVHGRGTFGSRSMSVGGAAFLRAVEKIVAKGKRIAAHRLEVAEDDVAFDNGRFRVAGTDREISLEDVARAAFVPAQVPRDMEPGLAEQAIVSPPGATFPNGCHICEVEIDPETGVVEILAYSVVDDVGRIVSPKQVKGQVHGGAAQGVGQILLEDIAYDPESGQLLSGSFMDYAMPRAEDLPFLAVESNEVPAKTNPLGIKGAGEAGTVGALPATVNAVVDALRPLGIRHIDMPLTPQRVWEALRKAGT